jgi:hypothetical protein
VKVEKGLGEAAGWGGVGGGVAIRLAAERIRGKSVEAQTAGAVLSRFRRVKLRRAELTMGKSFFIVWVGTILTLAERQEQGE